MRESLRDPARIEHMIMAINDVTEFMNGKTVQDLESDKLLRFAAVKALEVVGEAAYMLTKEFKDMHPETPWNLIVGLRHVLVHGYYQIKLQEVSMIISNDLPVLLPQLEQYLLEFDN